MNERAVKKAITLLLLLFFMSNSPSVFAQGSMVIPQGVGQIVVAESAAQKEVPMVDAVTTSELPVYIPEYVIEIKEEKISRKKRAKKFVSLKWVLFLKWFWTKPKINENSESARLLREWEEMLGVNIFYVYFKAQEARKKIREKFSFRVLGMRGTADIRDGKAFLILERKF